MNNYSIKFNSFGIEIPAILLPQNSDMQKWAVIACDQFTQDREFWAKIKTFTSDAPSTLNLIFPEVFLPDGDEQTRIKDIHSAMKRYMNEGVFTEPKQGFMYIERDTPFQKKRRGLIAAIDLEKYEWKGGSLPLIRSTEGTVPERLPARMDIRRGAPLEIPHVLLLIDDDTDSFLPAIAESAKKDNPVYDTQLMMNAGNVKGWFLDAHTDLSFIADKLDELCNRSLKRYRGGKEPFLFAAGDGNHSLAAAKGIWDEYKTANGLTDHPCRYALVEIENIYDPAIQFEPIHRLIMGAGFDETVSVLSSLPHFSIRDIENEKDLLRHCERLPGADEYLAANYFGIVSEGRYALIETSAAGIATACLQPLLDKKLQEDNKLSIDYIHDTEELIRLACEKKAAGILLPPVKKSGLFETVAGFGPLPRKSFSMGHSLEKRFYLECRRLFS
jgi:uncharacterized protein (DUF1015 family)